MWSTWNIWIPRRVSPNVREASTSFLSCWKKWDEEQFITKIFNDKDNNPKTNQLSMIRIRGRLVIILNCNHLSPCTVCSSGQWHHRVGHILWCIWGVPLKPWEQTGLCACSGYASGCTHGRALLSPEQGEKWRKRQACCHKVVDLKQTGSAGCQWG